MRGWYPPRHRPGAGAARSIAPSEASAFGSERAAAAARAGRRRRGRAGGGVRAGIANQAATGPSPWRARRGRQPALRRRFEDRPARRRRANASRADPAAARRAPPNRGAVAERRRRQARAPRSARVGAVELDGRPAEGDRAGRPAPAAPSAATAASVGPQRLARGRRPSDEDQVRDTTGRAARTRIARRPRSPGVLGEDAEIDVESLPAASAVGAGQAGHQPAEPATARPARRPDRRQVARAVERRTPGDGRRPAVLARRGSG